MKSSKHICRHMGQSQVGCKLKRFKHHPAKHSFKQRPMFSVFSVSNAHMRSHSPAGTMWRTSVYELFQTEPKCSRVRSQSPAGTMWRALDMYRALDALWTHIALWMCIELWMMFADCVYKLFQTQVHGRGRAVALCTVSHFGRVSNFG